MDAAAGRAKEVAFMSGLHPCEKLIHDLVNEFRVKWGGSDTEFRMAEELIALNLMLLEQEADIRTLLKDRHLAFHRDPPRQEPINE